MSISPPPTTRPLLRRLGLTALLLWAVATLLFGLIELSPGTAADLYLTPDTPPAQRARLIARFGLDQPATTRYVRMLAAYAQADFGESLIKGRPVTHLLAEALPNTLLLSLATLTVSLPVGVGIGILQAPRAGRAADIGLTLGSVFLYAMPAFWLALLLQLAAPRLGLPVSGMRDPVAADQMGALARGVDLARHLVLPGLAMGVATAAGFARHTRTSLLEVLPQDYIRAARARGISERRILWRHALPNALLPVVTLLGLSLPYLVGGSVLVETVFAWPGMGKLILDAIYQQDAPVVIGCFVLYALVVALGNLASDAMYAVTDPRIRHAR